MRVIASAATRIAQTVWHAMTGSEQPAPALPVDTVAAHVSPHVTAAVIVEGGKDWRTAGELAQAAILAAAHTAAGQST